MATSVRFTEVGLSDENFMLLRKKKFKNALYLDFFSRIFLYKTKRVFAVPFVRGNVSYEIFSSLSKWFA